LAAQAKLERYFFDEHLSLNPLRPTFFPVFVLKIREKVGRKALD
jgi:hypothetical protein